MFLWEKLETSLYIFATNKPSKQQNDAF